MTRKPVVYRHVLKLAAKLTQVETGNTPHHRLRMTGSSIIRILCRQQLKTLEHCAKSSEQLQRILHSCAAPEILKCNLIIFYTSIAHHSCEQNDFVTTTFPPVGVWSLITQFSRLVACYVSNGPLFQPGSCWGDARPQQP